MTPADSRRALLYTGLQQILGTEVTDALMSYLPTADPGDLVTKQDLAAFEERLNRRFEGRFDGVDQRFTSIDQRFEMIDQRFEMIDQRLDRMDTRFDRIDERLDRADDRYVSLEDRIARFHMDLSSQIGSLKTSLVGGLFALLAAVIVSAIWA